jgi:hypothetical protein
MVRLTVSCRVGQVTFRSSLMMSSTQRGRKKARNPRRCRGGWRDAFGAGDTATGRRGGLPLETGG